MSSSSSAENPAKKPRLKPIPKATYHKMSVEYAKKVIAAAVKVESVGTQTDEILSFNNAKMELKDGSIVAIDKKLANIIHCKGFQ